MFVNSFYLFVDGEIGAPGRASDISIAEHSYMLGLIRADSNAWLGVDDDGEQHGFVLGDGGFGNDNLIMTPIANAVTNRDIWFNYVFSSTRFFIEQCFGMWKNRFRVNIRASNVTHGTAVMTIYATMILNNYLQIHDSDEWATLVASEGYNPAPDFQEDVGLWMGTHDDAKCQACFEREVAVCAHWEQVAVELGALRHSSEARPEVSAAAPARLRNCLMWQYREGVADDLWAAFIDAHPEFDGVLSEIHMRPLEPVQLAVPVQGVGAP